MPFDYFYQPRPLPTVKRDAPANKFSVYQHFNRRVDMQEVVDTLRHNSIPVRVSDEGDAQGEWMERTIVGTPLRPKFWIEIPAGLFEKANFMLQEAAEADLEEEDLDVHPFNEYSVTELQEVLVEESNWSPDAVVVARRLLLRRGGDVDLKRLRDAAREKLAADFTPERGNTWLLLGLGIASAVAGMAVWILGIMILLGLLLYYFAGKRRDPKGVLYFAYDTLTRRQSAGGLAVLATATCLGLLNYFVLHWVEVPQIDSWLWWWR